MFEKVRPHMLAILFLSAVTLGIYWQATINSFLVYWDDNVYVTGNTAVRAITWDNIKTVFTTFYVGNYAPIQMISYMADNAIWGLSSSGFIFSNILLHIINGILLYNLLILLSWRRLPACLAALIFLVHPVQVESVVWISQRKNLLSLMFVLSSFYSYILYRDASGKRQGLLYLLSVFSFLVALLAKSVAVIFPLVLAVFDCCMPAKRDRRALMLDKIPFLILAVVVALVAMRSQSGEFAGGRTSYHGGTPYATLLTMLPVLLRYVGMTLWPTGLSAVYDPSVRTTIDVEIVLATVTLMFIALIGMFLYVRRRDLLFWLMFFFLGLLPVSQIVPLVTLMNDRYLYFPLVGAAAFIAGTVYLIVNNTVKHKRFVMLSAGALVTVFLVHCLAATYARIPIWRNEYALWEDAVKKVPNSSKAHFQFAHILEYQGAFAKAEEQYQLGLNLTSSTFERYSLARMHEKQGRTDKAVEEYQRILSQSPGFPDARNNIALIYIKQGKLEQAVEQYQLALRYNPAWVKGYNNLAVIYLRLGNKARALENFLEAIKLNPDDPELHYNLGLLYYGEGLHEKAVRELEIATRLGPGNPLFAEKLSEVTTSRAGRGLERGLK
jgi:tetratricopeptide (TPR) repeat protein